jgi:hypothetical protein
MSLIVYYSIYTEGLHCFLLFLITYFMFQFNHMEMCLSAEYVAETKGAKHLLHDSRKLNFLQYYSVDVIIFVSLIALIGKKLIQACLSSFGRSFVTDQEHPGELARERLATPIQMSNCSQMSTTRMSYLEEEMYIDNNGNKYQLVSRDARSDYITK